MQNVRDFIIRTILQDSAGKGIDALVKNAGQLTQKAYEMTVKVSTGQAEKAIKQVEQATKKAADIDTSKATKGIKDQTTALGGWTDRLKAMSEQSEKAGQTVGNLFQKLDAGKLIVAGAAAGLAAYAKSALTVAESHRLNIDLLKGQLGAQSDAAMSFIEAGDKGRGTSSIVRGGLEAYMSMTGYKDQKKNEKMIGGLEKIMASQEGGYLKNFGINNEQELLDQLSSGSVSETSGLGRFIKERSSQFFSPNALGIQKTQVANDFAKQGKINVSQEVIDAEARRRLAAKAIEDISGGVTEDKDSYRVGMRDLLTSFQTLNAGVGDAVRPAAAVILQFLTTLTRLLSEHPKIATLAAAFVVLGAALATVGVAGGLLVSAVTPLLALTKSQTVATLAHASAETIRATATKAATIAQAAMNVVMSANPLGIAIIAIAALVAGLYLLEKKFGLVTKAAQAFKNSEIGKDLLAGAKEGAEWLEAKLKGIWDTVQGVYKMFKGGDIGGALKGGLGLALKVSPIGMIAGFAEALNPSKRVQDEILYVLKKLKELWDGFTRWLDGIWTTVSKLLDPLLKLKEYLQALKDRLLGGEGLTGSSLKEALKKEMEKGGTYFGGMTPEQIDLLARYASGDKSVTGAMMSEAGITGPQIGEAKRLAEDLGESKPSIFQNPITEAIKKRDDAIAEVGADIQEKQDEAIEEKDFGGFVRTTLGGYWDLGKSIVTGNYGGSAAGGEVTKTGWELVHEGEPIVPAEVARSGPVIDALKSLASGGPVEKGSSGGIHIGDIIINSNSGDGRTLAQQFREELEKEMSDFQFKHRSEETFRRANRSYVA